MIFIGFHGTSRQSALNIRKVNFKKSESPTGWLGRGVYFFEENKQLAAYWPTTKSIANPFLIESKIEVDESKVLDLRKIDDRELFHKARKVMQDNIRHKIENNGYDSSTLDTCMDAAVIDFLCLKEGKLLVVLETYTYQDFDREYKGFSRVPNGTELCVKEVGIIKERNLIEI